MVNYNGFCQRERRSNALQSGVHHEPQQWAEEQFAGAKLTDSRRVARVKTIAEAMAVHPGRSIPQLCRGPYAVLASRCARGARHSNCTVTGSRYTPPAEAHGTAAGPWSSATAGCPVFLVAPETGQPAQGWKR